ncbi:MAG: tetratricopeptide repeat protein [Bacteroidales bacterium]
MSKSTFYKIKLGMLISLGMVLFFQIKFIAQTNVEYKILKDANRAYNEGEFQKAAEQYEKLVKTGYSAAELYYNLGNSYYRLGDYKSAILNFERAKKLAPGDENIQINLEFSQKYVQDKIEELPEFFLISWIRGFFDLFSSKSWGIISITGFIGFLSLALVFLFTRVLLFRKIAFYLGIIIAFISLVSFYASYKQYKIQTTHNTAIIFEQSVSVKSSPNENGTVLFVIHEGLKVTITGTSGNWKEIKLSDGKIGWLPKESIVEI